MSTYRLQISAIDPFDLNISTPNVTFYYTKTRMSMGILQKYELHLTDVDKFSFFGVVVVAKDFSVFKFELQSYETKFQSSPQNGKKNFYLICFRSSKSAKIKFVRNFINW